MLAGVPSRAPSGGGQEPAVPSPFDATVGSDAIEKPRRGHASNRLTIQHVPPAQHTALPYKVYRYILTLSKVTVHQYNAPYNLVQTVRQL